MNGADQKTETPIIFGASSGELGNPIIPPAFLATKNQNKTQANPHAAADQKNKRGDGKNDLNIDVVFLQLALDSKQLSLYEQTRTTVYG